MFETRRQVELRTEFWPNTGGKNVTTEQQVEVADGTQPLKPGRDGTVITGDGDLAHVQVLAEYVIEDPVRFLENGHVSNRCVWPTGPSPLVDVKGQQGG